MPLVKKSEHRGAIIDAIVIHVAMDPLLSLRALAAYSGLSVRTLRDCLKDPFKPLPHFRPCGKILVRRSEFDSWLEQFRARANTDLGTIVQEVLADLGVEQRARS